MWCYYFPSNCVLQLAQLVDYSPAAVRFATVIFPAADSTAI